MKGTCAVCGGTIITNLTGEQYFHLDWSITDHDPVPDGELEHTCRRPDPYCPRCVAEGRTTERPIRGVTSTLDYSFAHRARASKVYRFPGSSSPPPAPS